MSQPITSPDSSKILRASLWVAIGALVAAALVCVVWVLIGDDNGIIGKAFLTIILLAAFAGVTILEAQFASRRPAWLTLASMIGWILTLLVGAFLVWMPSNTYFAVGPGRFFRFVLIVLVVQGVLLHLRLYVAASARLQTTFNAAVSYTTIGLVVILGVMLVLPLVIEEFIDFHPLYWRVVVAITILAAVGTALIPLVNALFAPKRSHPAVPAPYGGYPQSPYGAAPAPAPAPALAIAPAVASATSAEPAPQLLPWPTFADATTPLPALPDGTPDWNAYYTGIPTFAAPPSADAAVPAAPPAPSVPPVPPVPPQPPVPPVPPVSPQPPVPPQPQG